jgi:hypothetical protein
MSNKIVLILFLSLLFTLSCFSQNYDFRFITWGINREEVKSTEKDIPVIDDEKCLVYDIEYEGKQFWLIYNFNDSKCVNGGYLLKNVYLNDDAYINNYLQLKDTMNHKYGEPQKDSIIWKKELNKRENFINDISINEGQLFYYTSWNFNNSEIILELCRDKNEIESCYIFYNCIENSNFLRDNNFNKNEIEESE